MNPRYIILHSSSLESSDDELDDESDEFDDIDELEELESLETLDLLDDEDDELESLSLSESDSLFELVSCFLFDFFLFLVLVIFSTFCLSTCLKKSKEYPVEFE